MIVVVSEDACRSKDMAHELERAETVNIPILPIRLDKTPLTGQFAYFLGNKQWLDMMSQPPSEYESSIVEAVSRLNARPGGPPAAGERVEPLFSSKPSPMVHKIAGQPRSIIQTLVAGAMMREKALRDFDLTDPRTLRFAFTILICVSVATAILHVPAWSAHRIGFASLPLFAADELIEQIVSCFLLYAAMRLFGGTADPLQFFSAFCLLGAYPLMSNICLVPVQDHAIALLAGNRDIGEFFRAALAVQAPVGTLAVILVGETASLLLKLVFALSLFRAFHITEQLGAARAAISFLSGIGMWILGALVFLQPFEANLYKPPSGP